MAGPVKEYVISTWIVPFKVITNTYTTFDDGFNHI